MAKRILVADDSVTIQKAFAMVLGGQDLALSLARSIEEATASARQMRPDLVIADTTLGSGSGYDLCSALKGDPGMAGVPVLILASSHTPYDEARGLRVGADGHLVKPFESQALIDQVTAILARPVDARPTAPARTVPPTARGFPSPTVPPPPPPAPRITVELDDDYDEFTIERVPSVATLTPPSVHSIPTPPAFHAPGVSDLLPPTPPSGLRTPTVPDLSSPTPPSGLRTPTVPDLFSPTPPSGLRQPLIPDVPPPAPSRPAPPPAPPPMRTIMGLPAVALPGVPGVAPLAARPAVPSVPAPAAEPPPRTPAPVVEAPARPPIPSAEVLSAAIAEKVASLSARGPEYEAIAKLSREVIEQVVWEVVPELAEAIIRQEVERLASAKRQ